MNTKTKQEIAILVNSCDKYEDAWDPFFKLLKIQWPDCPYKIYLNTEFKDYSCNEFDVEVINSGKETCWTRRVSYALNVINSDFVLFFLEDFFLHEKVNSTLFENIFKTFKDDANAGFLYIPPYYHAAHLTKRLSNSFYTKMSIFFNFRINACVALWRTEFFKEMLFEDLDPWLFEKRASRTSYFSKFKTYYVNPEYRAVIPYVLDPMFGRGIYRGKWLNGNKSFFDKYGINVNFNNLGTIEEDVSYSFNGIYTVLPNRIGLLLRKAITFLTIIFDFFTLRFKFKRFCKKVKHNKFNNQT